jgi:hypothetical protein
MARYSTPGQVWTRHIKPPKGSGKKAGRMYHAVTRFKRPDGSIHFDDPSRRVKNPMPAPEWYLEYAAEQRRKGLPL